MLKLALFRTAISSNLAVRTGGAANHGRSFFVRDSPRSFSIESEPPQQPHDSAVDSFLKTQSTGSVYARLYGSCITRNTLKTDIVNLLDCNLTLDDVKVNYDRHYNPTAMMVHFSSAQAFGHANKMISRKRFYQMDRIGKAQWDLVAPYDGKAVLLQGIPATANVLDLERFLSGCNYDDTSIQIFLRAGLPGKLATVRFPSQTQAMNCYIMKNKSFCQNNQVLVRILH